MTELETQAAEAKCIDCEQGVVLGYRPILDQPCDKCQGTGLRYPTLSRECKGSYEHTSTLQHGPTMCNCRGVPPYRVPDVTLEKVLLLGGNWAVDEFGLNAWGCTYYPRWEGYPEPVPNPQYGLGNTPQEAALAALLKPLPDLKDSIAGTVNEEPYSSNDPSHQDSPERIGNRGPEPDQHPPN